MIGVVLLRKTVRWPREGGLWKASNNPCCVETATTHNRDQEAPNGLETRSFGVRMDVGGQKAHYIRLSTAAEFEL